MLPEVLSNGICSLNPDEDRLTLSCIMKLDDKGRVKSSKIVESVIRSHYRMTYSKVQKILDAIAGNRMADMQNQINQLQLQNATAGIMRFPNMWTFSGGNFPPLTPATAA
jgi:ribonuclease R